MSINSDESVGFHARMSRLEHKLKQSEEERLKLEDRFKNILQTNKSEQAMQLFRLRESYCQLLERDRMRCERNDRILRTLNTVENRASMLTAKTDRLRLLRHYYETHMGRHYPSFRASDTKHLALELTADVNDSFLTPRPASSLAFSSSPMPLFTSTPSITRRSSLVIPDYEVLESSSQKFTNEINFNSPVRRQLFVDSPRSKRTVESKIMSPHIPFENVLSNDSIRLLSPLDIGAQPNTGNDFLLKTVSRDSSPGRKQVLKGGSNDVFKSSSDFSKSSYLSKLDSPDNKKDYSVSFTRFTDKNRPARPPLRTPTKPLTKSSSFSVSSSYYKKPDTPRPDYCTLERRSSLVRRPLSVYQTSVSTQFTERQHSPLSKTSHSTYNRSKSPLGVVDDIFKKYLINYDKRYLSDPISESKYGKYLYPPRTYGDDNYSSRSDHVSENLPSPSYKSFHHKNDFGSTSRKTVASSQLCQSVYDSHESLDNCVPRHTLSGSRVNNYSRYNEWKDWSHYRDRYDYVSERSSQSNLNYMDNNYGTYLNTTNTDFRGSVPQIRVNTLNNNSIDTRHSTYQVPTDQRSRYPYMKSFQDQRYPNSHHSYSGEEDQINNYTNHTFDDFAQNQYTKETFKMPQTPKKVSFSKDSYCGDACDSEDSFDLGKQSSFNNLNFLKESQKREHIPSDKHSLDFDVDQVPTKEARSYVSSGLNSYSGDLANEGNVTRSGNSEMEVVNNNLNDERLWSNNSKESEDDETNKYSQDISEGKDSKSNYKRKSSLFPLGDSIQDLKIFGTEKGGSKITKELESEENEKDPVKLGPIENVYLRNHIPLSKSDDGSNTVDSESKIKNKTNEEFNKGAAPDYLQTSVHESYKPIVESKTNDGEVESLNRKPIQIGVKESAVPSSVSYNTNQILGKHLSQERLAQNADQDFIATADLPPSYDDQEFVPNELKNIELPQKTENDLQNSESQQQPYGDSFAEQNIVEEEDGKAHQYEDKTFDETSAVSYEEYPNKQYDQYDQQPGDYTQEKVPKYDQQAQDVYANKVYSQEDIPQAYHQQSDLYDTQYTEGQYQQPGEFDANNYDQQQVQDYQQVPAAADQYGPAEYQQDHYDQDYAHKEGEGYSPSHYQTETSSQEYVANQYQGKEVEQYAQNQYPTQPTTQEYNTEQYQPNEPEQYSPSHYQTDGQGAHQEYVPDQYQVKEGEIYSPSHYQAKVAGQGLASEPYQGTEGERYSPSHYPSDTSGQEFVQEQYQGKEGEIYSPSHYQAKVAGQGLASEPYQGTEGERYSPSHYPSVTSGQEFGQEQYQGKEGDEYPQSHYQKEPPIQEYLPEQHYQGEYPQEYAQHPVQYDENYQGPVDDSQNQYKEGYDTGYEQDPQYKYSEQDAAYKPAAIPEVYDQYKQQPPAQYDQYEQPPVQYDQYEQQQPPQPYEQQQQQPQPQQYRSFEQDPSQQYGDYKQQPQQYPQYEQTETYDQYNQQQPPAHYDQYDQPPQDQYDGQYQEKPDQYEGYDYGIEQQGGASEQAYKSGAGVAEPQSLRGDPSTYDDSGNLYTASAQQPYDKNVQLQGDSANPPFQGQQPAYGEYVEGAQPSEALHHLPQNTQGAIVEEKVTSGPPDTQPKISEAAPNLSRVLESDSESADAPRPTHEDSSDFDFSSGHK